MERLTGKNEDGGYFLACSTNCKSMNCSFCDHDADAMNKLGAYEDAEEQGLLVRLPCKVGDTVYYLTGNPCLTNGRHFNRVEDSKCIGFYFDEKGLQICLYLPHGNHGTYGYFGDTIFLTREEAEAAIADMREADDG